MYETPAKFIQLAAMVKELRDENRKVLIWSNFVRNLEPSSASSLAYEPRSSTAASRPRSHSPAQPRVREREIERFRTDDCLRRAAANPAAMSEGISLHQVCHDAIYLDRTFNAGQFLQSVDRIHRLGLDPAIDTTIYFLMTRRHHRRDGQRPRRAQGHETLAPCSTTQASRRWPCPTTRTTAAHRRRRRR